MQLVQTRMRLLPPLFWKLALDGLRFCRFTFQLTPGGVVGVKRGGDVVYAKTPCLRAFFAAKIYRICVP